MNIEKQVCSLELSKRLIELGVEMEEESYFYWVGDNDSKLHLKDNTFTFIETSHGLEAGEYEFYYPAFTVAELGEMLPGNVQGSWFVMQKGLLSNLWYCSKECSDLNNGEILTEHQVEANTEADARAKMLIYLLENKMI